MKVCVLNYSSFFTGPTSFAPIIETAIGIVDSSGGQYHVLLIIADGQVSHCSIFIFHYLFMRRDHLMMVILTMLTMNLKKTQIRQ